MGKQQSKGKEESGRGITKVKHAQPYCGNPGCSKCFPELHQKMKEKGKKDVESR